MSYVPTNWKTGDIVTSEKLNKLENKKSEFKVFEVSKDNVLMQTSFGYLQSLLASYSTNPGTDTRMVRYGLTIGTDITENEVEELNDAAQYVNQHGIGYFHILNGVYPISSFYYNEQDNEYNLAYTILLYQISDYYFNITFKIISTQAFLDIIVLATPITDMSEEDVEEEGSGK